jgi:hypothetical protein
VPHPVIVRCTPLTSNAAGTSASAVVTGISGIGLLAGSALTAPPFGRIKTPFPPAALATKFPAHDTVLFGNPATTAVRIRLGRSDPCPVAADVKTAAEAGDSEQAPAVELVSATLVTWLRALPVVMMM